MNWRSVKPLVSDNIIDEFEETINYRFPDSFREFVKINNGGQPSHKMFNTKTVKERVFNNLLSFNKEDLNNVWRTNDWNGEMADWNNDKRMEKYVTCAQDAFGNLICFDKTNDKIVFIDHEDLNIEPVSNSFERFIKSLRKIR